MDANKLNALKVMQYKISPACGICVHGEFNNRHSDFGTCRMNTYKHEKHTGDKRYVSINRYGKCDTGEFEVDKAKLEMYNNFSQFYLE